MNKIQRIKNNTIELLLTMLEYDPQDNEAKILKIDLDNLNIKSLDLLITRINEIS